MTNRELTLILKQCKAYRQTVEGQFGKSTSYELPEMQDAAQAMEFLLEESHQRRMDFNNLIALMKTAKINLPLDDYLEKLDRMNRIDGVIR